MNCIARWKIGNIGNIVVHQQLNRQQIGNRPATSVTSLSISNLTCNKWFFALFSEIEVVRSLKQKYFSKQEQPSLSEFIRVRPHSDRALSTSSADWQSAVSPVGNRPKPSVSELPTTYDLD
jgi:hypothetical protein